jgi:hypothetical protein
MDKIPACSLVLLPERAGEEKDDTATLAPRGLPPLDDEDLGTLDGLSNVVEVYRMLCTSILLSSAGNPPRPF